jgi:Squalene-hopene cyclase C-terminal domain
LRRLDATLNHIPFADHGALLDRPTTDVAALRVA